MMKTLSYIEDHSSQLPALLFLSNLGYTYIPPEEALDLRGGRESQVILTPILEEWIRQNNEIRYKGSTYKFSGGSIYSAIDALRDFPLVEGLQITNAKVYDLLTLGKSMEEKIAGDRRSFSLQFVDWKNPERNVYHVTEEYSVERSGMSKHYRPDIVLFVNGIPLVVIECKRPDLERKEDKFGPVGEAVSQHLRNQGDDGIPYLYAYSQVLLSLASNDAMYGTTYTPKEYWSKWKFKYNKGKEEEEEQELSWEIHKIKNKKPDTKTWNKIFGTRFRYVREYFENLFKEEQLTTAQDSALYALCKQDRLLELIFRYIVFDGGIKKIARYQQYYAVGKTLKKILKLERGSRTGGVIWHTQGSGKSLTMVMLAKAIALEIGIRNPRVVLVTDRVDLDDQIYDTFKSCELEVEQAKTGRHLAEMISGNRDIIITTVIDKFESAVKLSRARDESPNIFVLVDESHRSQYGTANMNMQRTYPNACYIGFTGTPLMKKEKNTAVKFGGMIDTYTIDEAVRDGSVVPLLYEGRLVEQDVSKAPLDTFFERITKGMTLKEKADLKKKYSRADMLNKAEQRVYMTAWDISDHFDKNWKGTGFKAQLTAPSKVSAIQFKKYFDEIGKISTEVIISGPDTREGHEEVNDVDKLVVQDFWKKMMATYGSEKKYLKQIIYRFKGSEDPELIIVVDKLLTGFDAPRNTTLYVAKPLKEHNLLQAIARVNRVFPDKPFGFVIDYYGVLGELDEALVTYSSLHDFDEEDIEGTLTLVTEEVDKLAEYHSQLWDLFRSLKNRADKEEYERLLADEELRDEFYERLSNYAKTLKIALSTVKFVENTPDEKIREYKDDLKFFLALRKSVQNRYSDKVEFAKYEKQIQKLIDTHVYSTEVDLLVEQFNIMDKERFEEELDKLDTKSAKADTIASRTNREITERMDEDPHFYKKFAQLLKEAIDDYRAGRIAEAEYFAKVSDIKNKVQTHHDENTPKELKGKESAQAYYGVILDNVSKFKEELATYEKNAVQAGLEIDEIIERNKVVDWRTKDEVLNKMEQEIDDFLFRLEEDGVPLSLQEMDVIIEKSIAIAKRRG